MASERQKTILLVEDEALIAMAEKVTLERYGFNVISAHNGEEAIKTAESTPAIDLILMDINLGNGIDGTGAAGKILETRELPVIFLSSHAEREVVEKTEGITSYGYIVKNSGETVLIASIKMAFRLFEAKMKDKAKEEALFHAKNDWEDTFDSITDMVTVHDKDFNIIRANKAAERILGLPFLDKISDAKCFQYYHGTGSPPPSCPTCACLKTGQPYSFELFEPHLKRHLEIRAIPRFDRNRNLVGLIHVARDITERKQADESLRASMESFRGYFNMGTVGMCITSPQKGWIEVNDCLCRILGYSKEELLGLTWAEMTHADDLAADVAMFDQVLAGQRDSYELEKRFIRKDGQLIYLLLYATCLRNPDGTVHHFLASFVDISARKRVGQELRQTNAFFDSIIENIPNMVFIKEAKDLNFVRVNRAGEELMGHSRAELLGKNDHDFFPKAQADFFIEKDRQALRGNEVVDIPEEPLQTRDQGVRILHTRKVPILNAQGEPEFLLGISADITERKQAESQREAALEALRESEEKFRSITEQTSDLIALTDANGFITYASSVAQLLFQLAPEEMRGRHFTEFVDERVVPEAVALFRDTMARKGKVEGIEFPMKRKDGSIFAAEVNGSRFQSGVQNGILVVIRDISERKQAQGKIHTLLQEKELLLKETHHRIKNNMAVINGLLTLQANAQKDAANKNILLDAARRVQSMVVLYDKLYRSESFHELSIKDFLPPLIAEIVGVFHVVPAVKTAVRVEDFVLSAKILSPIGIIINELITNSMKYAFKGAANGLITVSASKKGDVVTLVYGDNGSGLPEAASFASTSTLGLQLVQTLVKQIAGSIVVERNKGTKYTIEFRV
jgi:PAS domain S-box-containing protein